MISFLVIICYFHYFFRVTAVDGQYQIGIYSVRKIQHGEEITFDYNSVTEVCAVTYRLLSILFHEINVYSVYLCLTSTFHLTVEQGGV